jgi:hypothetical protein
MIRLLVKTLNVGDVEDPDIYLGAAWYDFEQTEQGQWIKTHGQDLTYHRHMDYQTYGYKYSITGMFTEEDALYYKLKWGIS